MGSIIVTVIGWIVTLVAAIIPGINSRKRIKVLELDFAELNKIKAESADRIQFHTQKPKIINDLKKYEKAIELGTRGNMTLAGIERLLVQVDSYANRLSFSERDRKEISDLLNRISKALADNTIEKLNLRPADIEKIKVIIEKGEYSV